VAPAAGVALALALVASGAAMTVDGPSSTIVAAASGGASLVNDELVVASLDPNGLAEKAVLVSTVTDRGGQPRMVEDPSSTTNVSYLDRRGSPQTGDGVVFVEVGGPGTTQAVTEATFDKPLPLALHAEYALDGEVVPPDALVGASGEVTVRYTVTNTTATQQTLTYRDAAGTVRTRQVPVFVPFAGTLTVVLPRSLEITDPGSGVRASDASGRTVLRYSLLLAPPLGTFQQQAVLRARTADGATPSATLEAAPATSDTDPGTGFTSQALSGSTRGSTRLADGVDELGERTGELEQGAQLLADGTDQLASGAAVLAAQVNGPLLDGSRQLSAGADELAVATAELSTGLQKAEKGAQSLADGAAGLADGLGALEDGLRQLADGLAEAATGADRLTRGASLIADGLGSASDGPWPPPGVLPPFPEPPRLTLDELAALTPQQLAALIDDYGRALTEYVQALPDLDDLPEGVPPPTVVQSLRLLQQLTDAVLVVGRDVQGLLLVAAKQTSGAAATGAADLLSEVCGPSPVLTAPQCSQLQGVAADSALAAAASGAALAVNAGLFGLEQKPGLGAVPALRAGLQRVEQGVVALSAGVRSGDPADPGLVEGLAALSGGIDASATAARALRAGASDAVDGASGLASGADALAAGLSTAVGGSALLSDGAGALAEGGQALTDGAAALGGAADQLTSGAAQSATGTAAVAEGITAVRVEGIERLGDSVVAASREPALAQAWLAATDARASDALPYGAPDGAEGNAAYRLTMASLRDDSTPAWQWWALGVLCLAVAAWGVRSRLSVRPAA
jgi:putative membrane protein